MTMAQARSRDAKSPCCAARIQVNYETMTTTRAALVYTCLCCQRLYVVDSRDEDKQENES